MRQMQRSFVGAPGQELLSRNCSRYDLTETLKDLVQLIEDTMTLSERVFPIPDCGCSECMAVPPAAKHNTGLCAFHKAKRLLEPAPRVARHSDQELS